MLPITDYKELISAITRRGYGEAEWYFLIIVNPNNRIPAVESFLANYDYLHLRTGNIKYFIPGFRNDFDLRGKLLGKYMNGIRLNEGEPWKHFNLMGMLTTVEWLEQECHDYKYREGIDLIIIKSQRTTETTILDVSNLIPVRLEDIYNNGGNIINTIRQIGEIVERCQNIAEAKREIKNHLSPFSNIVKVFIAGSNLLSEERMVVRSQLQQIGNTAQIYITAYTYEDFQREFRRNGHQEEYNQFITNEADYVVFIINGRVGGITFNEFQVAVEAFKNNQTSPKILVYCKDVDRSQGEINEIIRKINELGQYYVSYRDIQDLEYNVYRDFTRMILKRR